jgi:hypothetical protein
MSFTPEKKIKIQVLHSPFISRPRAMLCLMLLYTAGFHGCDPIILRRALELLQSNGKVQLTSMTGVC